MFMLSRLLPSLTDFSKANNLTFSVESGALSFLIFRLLADGVTTDTLHTMVDTANSVYLDTKKQGNSEVKSAPAHPPAQGTIPDAPNVFKFPTKA